MSIPTAPQVVSTNGPRTPDSEPPRRERPDDELITSEQHLRRGPRAAHSPGVADFPDRRFDRQVVNVR